MENFHNISKFIKENDLKLFTDVSDDLICIICKRIMTNATSAPCRCRYCYECIKQYLNGKSKLFCPGSAKYCKIDKLNFKRDIHVDSMINSRISKLIVKCPQKTCEFKSELNLIKDHIEICDKRFVDCPYLQLGCSKEDVQLNNMTPHLYEDSFIHNKLLIEYINNFKNDVEILKNNMKTMADENVSLKEEMINNNLNSERKELKLNEIIETIQNENKTMKEEINNLLSENETKQTLLTQNNEQLNKSIEKIETNLNEKISILNNENAAMKCKIDLLQTMQENDDLRMKCQKIEENQREIETKMNELSELMESDSSNDDLDESQSDIEYCDMYNMHERNNDLIKPLKLNENIWQIESISEKIERSSQNKIDKFIYSGSFDTHKNGYKMCLFACPTGSGKSKGYFGVFFKLMRGPYDDILPWPCKINVTIQLIYQNSRRVFLSRERKYENNSNNKVYQKPRGRVQSKGLGFCHLIKSDILLKKTDLLEKNQLFINCITNLLD